MFYVTQTHILSIKDKKKNITALSNVFTFYHALFYVVTPLIHELLGIRPILRHYYCFDSIILIQSIYLKNIL